MKDSYKTQITAIIISFILTTIFVSVYYIFGSGISISLILGFGIGFITVLIVDMLGD